MSIRLKLKFNYLKKKKTIHNNKRYKNNNNNGKNEPIFFSEHKIWPSNTIKKDFFLYKYVIIEIYPKCNHCSHVSVSLFTTTKRNLASFRSISNWISGIDAVVNYFLFILALCLCRSTSNLSFQIFFCLSFGFVYYVVTSNAYIDIKIVQNFWNFEASEIKIPGWSKMRNCLLKFWAAVWFATVVWLIDDQKSMYFQYQLNEICFLDFLGRNLVRFVRFLLLCVVIKILIRFCMIFWSIHLLLVSPCFEFLIGLTI